MTEQHLELSQFWEKACHTLVMIGAAKPASRGWTGFVLFIVNLSNYTSGTNTNPGYSFSSNLSSLILSN